jgi:hypothetical protein
MDDRASGSRHAPNSSTPLFVAQRPDHLPPDSLGDAELAASIESLHRKLHAARRRLRMTQIAAGALAALIVGAVLALLWAGPTPFFVRFLGRGTVTTTYDAVAWWIALIVLAIAGVLFGDQLLRGKARVARRWHHRVSDLERRLSDAVGVLEGRRGKRAS